jgi:hypothetical protein
MHKVTYKYTHPTDATGLISMTTEELAYRDTFLTWAYQNGLVATETSIVDTKTIMHEVLWSNKIAFDAFRGHFGQEYHTFVDNILAQVEAKGGSHELIEADIA